MNYAEVTCPYCWESVQIIVDAGVQHLDTHMGQAEFVQDCTVCCHPIRLRVEIDRHGAVNRIDADRENE